MGWGSRFKKAVRRATKKVTRSVSRVTSGVKSVASRVSSGTKSIASKVSSTTKSIASNVGSATKSIASNVGSVAKTVVQANIAGAMGVAEGFLSGKGIIGAVSQGISASAESLGLVSAPISGADGSEYVFESPYPEDTTNVEQQEVNQTVKTATASSVGANVEGWKGRYNAFSYALKNCLKIMTK